MHAPFYVGGVNLLEVLVFLALLVAGAALLLRGRGASWSVLGGCGFGVLAVARLANLLSYQWLIRSSGTPAYQRIRVLEWFSAGVTILGLAGLGLLLAAVLAGRSRATAATRTATGAAESSGFPPPA